MGVDIDEDASTIVVGMPNDDREAANAGAAFVFERVVGAAPWARSSDVLVDAAGVQAVAGQVQQRIEVDVVGRKYSITPSELLELKGRAAKLFSQPPSKLH